MTEIIYKFSDYKSYINARFFLMPRKGRGQARQLADHLKVHSVVVSQVLSGSRDFTHEQSLMVAEYFGLDERATEYLTLLILKARAGTKKLRDHLQKKIDELKADALDIKNRVPDHQTLSEEDMAIFYSNWFYSGIRLLTSIPHYNSAELIAERFGFEINKVRAVVEYLVSRGLCAVNEKGKLVQGGTSTFISAQSPFINNLHRNWRIKALEHMPKRKENDFFYSAPCSISAKDKSAFREELIRLVGEFSKRLEEQDAEQLACLNIDWFDF